MYSPIKINKAVTALILLVTTFSAHFSQATAQTTLLFEGSYQGAGYGQVEIQVDSWEKPSAGWVTKTGGSCSVRKGNFAQPPVPIMRDGKQTGLKVYADLYGSCGISEFSFEGPDEKGVYQGAYVGNAGGASLMLKKKN